MNKNRGFTLIELLVVIAIIGILSSVVLASLNTARSKGADAAIKENLNNIRAQAELVYDNDGNYSNVCTNANVVKGVGAASSAGGGTWAAVANNTAGVTACLAASGTWVAFSQLKADNTKTWCVDSSGSSKQETVAASTLAITACP
jgi:prepilin-type N-terminal cleavage/methylation domain-containing protein